MTRYWSLPEVSPRAFDLPLERFTALLGKLGRSDRASVAEELLGLVRTQVPMAQCTLFSFEGAGRPRILGVGDRARTQALPRIAQDYAARFYALDGSQAVMRAEAEAVRRAGPSQPRVLLHLQRGDEIAHREYRAICYELPQVSERLAVLAWHDGLGWLSVNFYRGLEHGAFDPRAIEAIEAFAPLVVHAARLHHARQQVDDDLSALLLARVARRCPGLTKRDLDVVRALLAGLSTEGLADRLGLTVGSAQTYSKRVYRKLGVSGQRELFGWLLEPESAV